MSSFGRMPRMLLRVHAGDERYTMFPWRTAIGTMLGAS